MLICADKGEGSLANADITDKMRRNWEKFGFLKTHLDIIVLGKFIYNF